MTKQRGRPKNMHCCIQLHAYRNLSFQNCIDLQTNGDDLRRTSSLCELHDLAAVGVILFRIDVLSRLTEYLRWVERDMSR